MTLNVAAVERQLRNEIFQILCIVLCGQVAAVLPCLVILIFMHLIVICSSLASTDKISLSSVVRLFPTNATVNIGVCRHHNNDDGYNGCAFIASLLHILN